MFSFFRKKDPKPEVKPETCNNVCKNRLNELERLEEAKRIAVKQINLLKEVSIEVYDLKESLLDKLKCGSINAKVNEKLANICKLIQDELAEEEK